MKPGIARIFVQNSFCGRCMTTIKKKVLEVPDVQNINLYPSDSLVVFNFMRANQVSEVLNTLTTLGYPPKGDNVSCLQHKTPTCSCNIHKSFHKN